MKLTAAAAVSGSPNWERAGDTLTDAGCGETVAVGCGDTVNGAAAAATPVATADGSPAETADVGVIDRWPSVCTAGDESSAAAGFANCTRLTDASALRFASSSAMRLRNMRASCCLALATSVTVSFGPKRSLTLRRGRGGGGGGSCCCLAVLSPGCNIACTSESNCAAARAAALDVPSASLDAVLSSLSLSLSDDEPRWITRDELVAGAVLGAAVDAAVVVRVAGRVGGGGIVRGRTGGGGNTNGRTPAADDALAWVLAAAAVAWFDSPVES